MANQNPSVLIAAEVEFDREKYQTQSDLTIYFQDPKNGGCEVLASLTPYQNNPAKAVVVFHPDSCEEDIIRDLEDNKSDDTLRISRFQVEQIFGETTTYVEDATAEKLLSAFKFENLRKRVRYQCGFDIELSANPKRIKLTGNFSHLKIAEDCLKQIVSDIDGEEVQQESGSEDLSQEEEEEDKSADKEEEETTGATQELKELDLDEQNSALKSSSNEIDKSNKSDNQLTENGVWDSDSESEQKGERRTEAEGAELKTEPDTEEEPEQDMSTKPKTSKADKNKPKTTTAKSQSGTKNKQNLGEPKGTKSGDTGKKTTTLQDVFDHILYEYMVIEIADEYDKQVTSKFRNSRIEAKPDKGDMNVMMVVVTSPTKKEAEAVKVALNDLFLETTRAVTPLAIKLNKSFTGDCSGLREDLKLLRGRGLLARLVTDEDIRIIGYITDMDRNINVVENYIEAYMVQHPECKKAMEKLPQIEFGSIRIRVECSDLLLVKCDAVVNSADPYLGDSTAISRAIFQVCGREFVSQAQRLVRQGPLTPAEACEQEAQGRLLKRGVKFVIHVLGPDSRDPEFERTLSDAIWNALQRADHLKVQAVAFPAIGSGMFQLLDCTEAYWKALQAFSSIRSTSTVTNIIFATTDEGIAREMHQIFTSCAKKALLSSHSQHSKAHSSTNMTSSGRTSHSSSSSRPASRQNSRGAASDPYGGASGSNSSYGAAAAGGIDYDDDDDVQYGAPKSMSMSGMRSTLPSNPGYGAQQPAPPPSQPQSNSYAATAQSNHSGGYGQQPGVHNAHNARNSSTAMSQVLGGGQVPLSSDGRPGSSGRHGAASATPAKPPADDQDDNDPSKRCPICLDDFTDPKELPCKHKFCKPCLAAVEATSKSHQCPVCRVPFAVAEGTQPVGGTMTTTRKNLPLPGYERYGTIIISYYIPSGTQGPEHPNPGIRFSGTQRTAYLPDNEKGRRVEKLLRKAFNQRLTFTVGTSITTGASNIVVWNDIHHKTSPSGGPQSYGYPDPDYLDRVMDDLKARGIKD